MKSSIVQPFASNDTYICPDCGSEVRVGARRCPGCGPFRPITQDEIWQESDDSTPPEFSVNCLLAIPAHHLDSEKASEPVTPAPPKFRLPSVWLCVLIGLVIFSAALAAVKLWIH